VLYVAGVSIIVWVCLRVRLVCFRDQCARCFLYCRCRWRQLNLFVQHLPIIRDFLARVNTTGGKVLVSRSVFQSRTPKSKKQEPQSTNPLPTAATLHTHRQVHCMAGVSRSASIAIFAAMCFHQVSQYSQ